MFRRVLVGLDGSDESKKALAAAIAIAKIMGCEIQSISVKERPSHYAATVGEVMEDQEEIDKFFAHVTEEARDLAEKEGVELQCEIRSGHVVETIVEFAGFDRFDLIVLGPWNKAESLARFGAAFLKP
jgi:nucleotide-binding universal stress UspA family protein